MGATLELQRQEQADLWEQEYLYNQDFRQARGQGFVERLMDSANNVEPSPENIRILVDMGFEQAR